LLLNDQDRFCPESDRTQGLALFDLLELLMFPQTDKAESLGQRAYLPQITKALETWDLRITCTHTHTQNPDTHTNKDISIAFFYIDRKAGSIELTAG
jgi:hypothetical protein